ncbi:unnamed protein product [Tilletia laevis]|uniref:PHD-type domain-containing protein n=1 Tax=Tilletia laevis TaxID=157183 RepID=A0A9N8QKD4_9BASI|nr:unnamed protein product [Tilletia laevis]
MREEHRGLREDNMFLRQQLSERLAVPPMPQHASASQTQTHGHATTMPARPAMTSLSMAGRGGPAAAPAAPAFQAAQRIRAMSSQAGPSSLRVHATSGTSFPTQRHASMKAASTASISVDEPVKVKLHNDRIYYIPWHKVGARVATPNFHEVLAQWCCVISSPSITGGSSGDDVWECLFTSLRPYQDDLLKYGFRVLAIFARKQAYVVSLRPHPPETIFPPLPHGTPSLEVAFETVKHVPGGKASSRTFPPSHTSAAGSQCDFCGAIMPAKFLTNHSCDAKPRVKVEGGGVKVEGASKVTNEIIEISSDEHSDAEPDAEGAEGAGPLNRKIAAVEAKAKKDKKRKLSGTSDSAGKERHAAPSATSKKGCGSTQQQYKVKVDPKNDPKKQICPVCNKKETPEPWSEDETGQGNGKLKSPEIFWVCCDVISCQQWYHSDCLEVVAQGGLRHEKPRAGKAWRCAVCKLAGLIPKKP